MQGERDRALANPRRFSQPEHFLKPDGQDRPHGIPVVHWNSRPARHHHMSRGHPVQRAAPLLANQVQEGAAEIDQRQVIPAGESAQPWPQPPVE